MADLPTDRVRAIESLVINWLDDADAPGVSVVVVDEDGECYAEGFGARDLESNAPATPDTLYGMGSITKSFTALSVLQLAEDGRLSVDDPVDEYVDYFADAPGEPIEIRELLSHTSGMPALGPGLLAQSIRGIPAGVADRDDRERWIRESVDLRVTDRDRFFYYNAGYGVLGDVIETVDGRRYADYVREEVLEPLGMGRSTFDPEPFEADDDAMTGYEPGDEAPEPAGFPFEELIHPAGGLVSSTRELGRFVRATMTDGTLDGNRVCSPDTLERLQRGRAAWKTTFDGSDLQYGFGWYRTSFPDDELVGHGGSILVSTAYAGFLEEAGLGIAVACNTSAQPHPHALATAILAVATGNEPTTVPAFALERKCEAVEGTYESLRGDLTATVERDGGGITVSLSSPWGDEALHAFPESLDPDDHEFYTIAGSGERLSFEFDLEGDRADLFFERHRLERTHTTE